MEKSWVFIISEFVRELTSNFTFILIEDDISEQGLLEALNFAKELVFDL